MFLISFYDWLVGFNHISTHLRLFNPKKLENCVHCILIFTFLCSSWLWYQVFLFNLRWFTNRLIWSIDGTVTGTTSSSKSEKTFHMTTFSNPGLCRLPGWIIFYYIYIYIYIYIYMCVCVCVCVRVGRPEFNPRSSHTKDSKNGTWCLLA